MTQMVKDYFACQNCLSDMQVIFSGRDYRRPGDKREWPVGWCNKCQQGSVVAMLNPADVAEFYAIEYYTHGAAEVVPAPRSFLDKIRTHLAWRFDGGIALSANEVGPPGKACDIGCGAGENVQKLKAAGFDVVGVEPDPKARKVASTIAPVFCGTAEEMPDGIGVFDYVLMSHVLEHTISPQKSLHNMYALLRSGGKLIVEVPNCEALGFREFEQYWPWTDLPRHLHFFTERSLRNALVSAGFKVTAVYHVGYSRQFSNDWINLTEEIRRIIGGEGSSDKLRTWTLLFRTMLLRSRYKYDSIRLHAIK